MLQEVSRSIEGPLRVCLFFAAVVAAFVMAKGASSSKQEGTASTEQKAVEAESKRLLDLSFSRGVLSQNKAHPANPLRPSKGLVFFFFLGVLSFRAYIISFSSVAAEMMMFGNDLSCTLSLFSSWEMTDVTWGHVFCICKDADLILQMSDYCVFFPFSPVLD